MKTQTDRQMYIIFLAVFLGAYLFFGTQTAISKNINALGGGIGYIQCYSENPWHLLNNNISPKELKIIAIERLSYLKNHKKSLVNTHGKKILSHIDRAFFHINKSLKENLWKDPWHLNWAEGSLVFNAEARAAQHLKRIITYDNETVKKIANEALHNLVLADYVLSITVLNEALVYKNTSRKIERLIGRSKTNLKSGKNFAGYPKKAIKYFRRSWRFASLALKKLPTVSISVSPATIPLNGTATLTWSSTNTDTLVIDNGIGTVGKTGSINVSPIKTTTYTITLTNINGATSATVTVKVIPPPTAAINAEPSTIFPGEKATLTWGSTNAERVFIDNGIGEVEPSGSINVFPPDTTTYTITAINNSGTITDIAIITVIRKPEVLITADPLIIPQGGSLTLSWASSNADTIFIDNGIGEVEPTGSIDVSPRHTTTYTITATTMTSTNPAETSTDTVTITVISKPTVSISIDPMHIHTGQMATLSWTTSNAETINIDNGIGEVDQAGSIDVSPTHTTTYTITATNPSGNAKDTATLKVIHINPLPEGSFGKQYEELIPEDAAIEEYDEKRFCVITGFVYTMDETGEKAPLFDVTISLHNHPEYGTTQTNQEGRFAIPADGGGTYTIVYEKEGYIQAQRKVKTPWSEVVLTEDDPVLIQKDPKTTKVFFDGNPDTIIIHESTPVTDERGTRSCTLVFRGDNKAYTNDGRELDTITTSVTEYLTPDSMPAILPPYTQFTYCAEFSAEEAEGIRFEKPVIAYVEDFLGFGTGGIVPVGFYDRDRAVWVPCRNGLIVTLLDTDADSIVDALDADGDSIPDDINHNGSVTDDARGLEDPKRYKPGATYWRIGLDHFSTGDFNWSSIFYPSPKSPCPVRIDKQLPKDCKNCPGSFVEHRSRILHEDIPILGTDWTIHYASNRTSGYKYKIIVPVTTETPPCNAISVCVRVAGNRLMESFVPSANLKAEFIWNGVDFLGNKMYGTVPVSVDIKYHYVIGNYMIPVVNSFGDMPPELLEPSGGLFGWPGSGYYTSKPGEVSFRPVSSGGGDRSIIFSRTLTRKYYINVQQNPKDIAEGWTISAQNHLVRDPVAPSALYKGDGTILENEKIIKTIAGTGIGGYNGDNIPSTQARLNGPIAVATDSEGNLYILQERQKRVRKVDTDGIITTVAGGGSDTRDGIPATEAQIYRPEDIAVDNEGNLHIIDCHSIRKVDTNGIITTIVNKGGKIGYSGDGGPAKDAWLWYPTSIACDSNGNIYIADSGNNRVRMVNTNGIINTNAGDGMAGYTGDEGPAIFASITPYSIDVDSKGNIYIMDSGSRRILKVSPGGSIATFADLTLSSFSKIAVDSQDNLYFAHQNEYVIKMINKDGEMVTVAGSGDHNHGGDYGAPLDASFSPRDVAINPIGDIYIADWWNERVRGISRSFVFASDTGILVPDEGGIGYIMSPEGYHLATIDLHTQKMLLSFGYDEFMRLISIKDRFGNETRIKRDSAGCPLSIISPDGIITTLTIDMSSHLRQVTYQDGSCYYFDYTPGGLMTDKYDPRGNHFEYLFDTEGRITDVFDPEGGHWNYQRTMDPLFNVLTYVTTGEGNTTTYSDYTDSTGYYISNIISPTGDVTDFIRSADGLRITKELPCGMSLWFKYGIDLQFRKSYIQQTKETTPDGLTRTIFTEKAYKDTNGDGLKDLITTKMTINDKAVVNVNNTIEGIETTTSPEGRTVTSCYDPDTLLTKSINVPGLYEISYSYDTRGRLTSINTHTRNTSFAYNAQGLLESITDPENHTTTYTYDLSDRITGIIRPDGTSVGLSYDQNGNMTLLTTPSLIAHGFGYNGVNMNTFYQTPKSGAYSYVYDKDRQLVQTSFPSGRQKKNIYDKTRLVQIQTPEGNIDFTHLCGSKVGSITWGTESITYDYDGKLIKQENLSGTLREILSYTYNNDFSLASFTYAGDTINYSYDNDGLLIGVGDFTIARNTQNGLPEVVTDGTLSLANTFNGYGEVKGQDFAVNGNNISSWSLFYDNEGKIAQKTEVINGTASFYTYTYDPTGQLLKVSKDGTLVEEYQYSPNGNRTYEMNTLRGILGRDFTYSDEDQLLTAGETTYHYNADCFLTGKKKIEDISTYNYSSRGELLNVMLPDGRIVEYIHDPLGRRIAKKLDGVVTEKYLWQGMMRLLAVYDGSDNLLMRFEYADARMPITLNRGSSTYYISYDHIGSPRIVAHTSGNVVKRIDYDSFGNIIIDTNPSFYMPFGFAGGLYDNDIGILRFGYRDYDPDIGRWLTPDPIGFEAGDLNLYRYVWNNPVNWVDPSGLFVIFFGGQGSAGAGLGIGVSSGKWVNIIWDKGPKIEHGYYIAGEHGAHIGISAGGGGEAGVMFTNDWEALKGLYMTHGGSGGILGMGGVDVFTSFSRDTAIWGISGNLSVGVGIEGHSRIGVGSAWKTGEFTFKKILEDIINRIMCDSEECRQ